MKPLSEVFLGNLIYTPKEKEVILFIIPIIVYLLYILGIIPTFYHDLDHNIFIALYSSTIGYRYVEPYISKVKNKAGNIFIAALYITIVSSIFSILGFLISGRDPQGLSKLTNSFSHFFYKDFFKYVFIGIGEELLCFYILLTFASIIKGRNRFIISVLITSIIFGSLHGIGWPIMAVFPIAFSHIPYIYSYGKFKSLLPAMFVHSIHDMVSAINLIPDLQGIVPSLISIIFPILMFVYWKKVETL